MEDQESTQSAETPSTQAEPKRFSQAVQKVKSKFKNHRAKKYNEPSNTGAISKREKQLWWFRQPEAINRFTGWLVAYTLLLVLCTAGLAVVAYWQYGTLEKTDQTMRSGERAWVGWDGEFTIDALETMPQLNVEAHASVKNFGHGPALKTTATIWFENDGKILEGAASCDGNVKFATGTVPHGPNVFSPGPMGYSLFPEQERRVDLGTWTGDGIPDLKFFWLIGCVAYVDQFGVSHWSRIVMQNALGTHPPFTKDTPLQFYSLFNDTDESEGQKPNHLPKH